jgi:hypothetical protein
MNQFIILIDDDTRYEGFLRDVQRNVQEITQNDVEVVPIVGVVLATAKVFVLAEIERIKQTGRVLAGIGIDVADRNTGDSYAGVTLLNEIRREAGYQKGAVRIVLVTVTGHLEPSDAPEADDIVSRMEGAGPKKAAIRLITDFGLQEYLK